MRSRLRSVASFLSVSLVAALAAVEPAAAGVTPVPGPVIGAGLPALALFAGGYYLIRKRRAR